MPKKFSHDMVLNAELQELHADLQKRQRLFIQIRELRQTLISQSIGLGDVELEGAIRHYGNMIFAMNELAEEIEKGT